MGATFDSKSRTILIASFLDAQAIDEFVVTL